MAKSFERLQPMDRASHVIDVQIEGRRVSSIRPTAEEGFPDGPPARLVFPGFVNAHTHLPMVLFRGLADDVPLRTWLEQYVWPLEKRLTPEDVYWCTLLGIAEGIRSGSTAFVDMYFHCDEIARAVEESGVRALLSYGMIAPSLDAGGADELANTRSLVKRWNGRADGRIRVAVAPHSLYTCGEDVWRESIELARSFDVPIHTHLAETRREVDDWKAREGTSPVQSLDRLGAFSVPTVAAHCVHVDEADIDVLASGSAIVAHCPKSNAKLGSGIAPVAAMQRAGVRVALGTDGAASNNRLDMLEELRAAWLVQRAHIEDAASLTSADVVGMAIEPARSLLGLPAQGLVEGAPGDLVLMRTEGPHTTPAHDASAMMAYASQSADVTDVYVDGKPLLECGELRTIDEERVKSEVRRLLHRIINR